MRRIHRPQGTAVAGKMLFMVAAEMERDLIRERIVGGLRAAGARARRPPAAVDEDCRAEAHRRWLVLRANLQTASC